MSTQAERQRERENNALMREVTLADMARAQRISAGRAVHQHRSDQHLRTARPSATQAQLAIVARHLESIRDPNQVHTPEKPAEEITKRAVSLVDVMHKDGQLTFDLNRAAEEYRELFFTAMGPSKGVSSYGDYVAAEPSGRLPTNHHQIEAYEKLKHASVAAFGVLRKDGRWAVDEQLMSLVVPAILSDKKEITQAKIGEQRTMYRGRAQVSSAGGAVVFEVLNKLSLHFTFRER